MKARPPCPGCWGAAVLPARQARAAGPAQLAQPVHTRQPSGIHCLSGLILLLFPYIYNHVSIYHVSYD